MIKVKITIPGKIKYPNIFNFTNTSDNIFNNKKYYINTYVDSPDFWFINENLYKKNYEEVKIDKKNIIFLGSETIYDEDYFLKNTKINYLNQFDSIFSPKPIYLNQSENTPPFLPWKLRGGAFEKKYPESDIEYYENLFPIKNKLMSVYSSLKDITEHQKLRINFLNILQNRFDGDIDFFGRDIKKTATKEKGILNYKYHIVIENNIYKNIISEKIFDSYLGLSYPLYSGGSNLEDFFPIESFTKLDLNDFTGSIQKIEHILENDPYDKKVKVLKNARNIVLNKFNLIYRIYEIVESKLLLPKNSKKIVRIYSKKHFENKSFSGKLSFQINSKLTKIIDYLQKFYT
jgi:hypothetical protein